jgi:hypothetical protein
MGVVVPYRSSLSPPSDGLFQVMLSGSGKFFGKSAVLSALATQALPRNWHTPLEAPSVKSTMMRSLIVDRQTPTAVPLL